MQKEEPLTEHFTMLVMEGCSRFCAVLSCNSMLQQFDMLETAGHKMITLRMVIMISFFRTLLWVRRDEVPNFRLAFQLVFNHILIMGTRISSQRSSDRA
jgi:hypothetical protein